jgi:hypothetical protein
LGLLRELVPAATRFAVLINPYLSRCQCYGERRGSGRPRPRAANPGRPR